MYVIYSSLMLKGLKGVEQERREEKQRFQKGGKLGQGVCAWRGAGTPSGLNMLMVFLVSVLYACNRLEIVEPT